MSIKRYDCSPGVDGHMSEDADGEYVRHEDIADVLKDAERYRWLRMCDANQEDAVMIRGDCYDRDELLSGAELDAAIDAAMSGASSHSPEH